MRYLKLFESISGLEKKTTLIDTNDLEDYLTELSDIYFIDIDYAVASHLSDAYYKTEIVICASNIDVNSMSMEEDPPYVTKEQYIEIVNGFISIKSKMGSDWEVFISDPDDYSWIVSAAFIKRRSINPIKESIQFINFTSKSSYYFIQKKLGISFETLEDYLIEVSDSGYRIQIFISDFEIDGKMVEGVIISFARNDGEYIKKDDDNYLNDCIQSIKNRLPHKNKTGLCTLKNSYLNSPDWLNFKLYNFTDAKNGRYKFT